MSVNFGSFAESSSSPIPRRHRGRQPGRRGDPGGPARCTHPVRAVILDTETTDLDGYAEEIAVVDAGTGETLLAPWSIPAARSISAAPAWADVVPSCTAGHTILAYTQPPTPTPSHATPATPAATASRSAISATRTAVPCR